MDKACQNQECVNPCLTTQCGTRALCEVDFHTAICVCPPGLQGNPLLACIEAGCSSDNECATDQKCDYIEGSSYTRKECQPVCTPGKCNVGADCVGRDHRATCRCRPPLQGDGIISCIERKQISNICPYQLVNKFPNKRDKFSFINFGFYISCSFTI